MYLKTSHFASLSRRPCLHISKEVVGEIEERWLRFSLIYSVVHLSLFKVAVVGASDAAET